MMIRRRAACPAITFLVALACACQAQGQSRGPATDLKGAATDEHIWFAAADAKDPEKVRLYHHAVGMEGPYYRTPMELPGMPAMIAAHGNSAWLVFDPPPNEGQALRDVYTIQAERSPATGIFFYVPDKVPKLIEGFTAAGALSGFAAGPEGPIALLTPYEWAEAGVRRADGSEAPPGLTTPRLLTLRRGQWVDDEPPPLVEGDRPIGLIADPANASLLVVAQRRAQARQTIVLYERDEAGVWSILPTGIAARGVHAPARQGGRLLLSVAAEPGASGESTGARVGFLRGSVFVPLGVVAYERDAILVAATARDIRVIRAARDGVLSLQRVDPITGEVSPPESMTGQPLSTASRVYFPLLATVFTAALLLAILIRPASSMGEKERPAVQPAPLGSRMLALLADFVPAGIAAIAMTGSEVKDLLSFPLWATTVGESAPIMIAAGLTALHGMIGEMFWQASFGKALVGLKVARADGQAPRPWQALVRNVFKAVCIIMPPVAVFALLNPYRQQLGDAVARTIVVAEPDDESPSPPTSES